MDKDLEKVRDLGPEEPAAPERVKLRIVRGSGSSPVDPNPDAQFEKLMRASDEQPVRQRRWHFAIACALGVATAMIGYIALFRILSR